MARWFDFDESPTTGDDLPWMKEYIPNPDYMLEGYEVEEVYPGDRGILLITAAFKAFLFKREKAYYFLLEALEVWVEDPTPPCNLIIKHQKSGKVVLGVDENSHSYTWVLDGKRYVRRGKQDGTHPQETPSNPLLPPSHSRTRPQATQSPPGSSGTSDSQNATARSAKKRVGQ